MADPFNFDSLRRETPSYLGLGALKDALPVPAPREPPASSAAASGVADISMEDQIISDEECDDADMDIQSGVPHEAKPAARNVETGETHGIAPDAPPLTSPAPRNEPAHSSQPSATTHKVLSPTQFGAHWALDSPAAPDAARDRYGYEVRMPIPAPWHENLPYTLSTYLQLLFNLGVALVGVWVVLVAKRDVSAIIRERSDEISLKASWCHQQYVLNRCTPDRVAPHLVASEVCLDLERCMDRDPANLRWLSVHASLLSEVLNALIEPLTIRTMVSLALLAFSVGLAVFMINYLFGFLRARTYFPSKRDDDARHERQLHISAVPHHHAPESKL